MKELEDITLETLSFFQELSIDQLIMQMDKKKIESMPALTVDHLRDVLNKLEKDKRIVRYKIKRQNKKITVWKKRFIHARPWWRRLLKL